MIETISNFMLNHTPLLYLTQSLWRDEAFSAFISRHSIFEIIALTKNDFNPPFYYILLHIWMKMFGYGVATLRLFSFAAFVLLCITVFLFAKKLFKSRFAIYLATLLTITNPMLVYFAFELRMYALLALLATASTYFLYTKQWKWYVVASAAGIYTQPFMAFVFLAQGVYMALIKKIRLLIKPWIAIGLVFLPWIPVLLSQFAASGSMWIFPVDARLILSALGNLYVGYEGTPPNLWNIMKILSLLLVIITAFLLKNAKQRKQNLLFITWVYVPMFLVLGISLIKPIYVHRYVIFITIGEIFLITAFIQQYIQKHVVKLFAVVFLIFFAAVNIYAAPFHKKADFAKTFTEIKNLWKSSDFVLAKNPLNFYESLYYAPDPTHVFLYNPYSKTPPRFVGDIGMPESVWQKTYPTYPDRAFLIHNDGSFEIVSSL